MPANLALKQIAGFDPRNAIDSYSGKAQPVVWVRSPCKAITQRNRSCSICPRIHYPSPGPVELPCLCLGNEVAMRRIIQANINRFRELLKIETDPTKRVMETRLLLEEEEKLKQLPPHDENEAKLF